MDAKAFIGKLISGVSGRKRCGDSAPAVKPGFRKPAVDRLAAFRRPRAWAASHNRKSPATIIQNRQRKARRIQRRAAA